MVRKYSYEFKKYLVTLLESGLISANELARRYNIHKEVDSLEINLYSIPTPEINIVENLN